KYALMERCAKCSGYLEISVLRYRGASDWKEDASAGRAPEGLSHLHSSRPHDGPARASDTQSPQDRRGQDQSTQIHGCILGPLCGRRRQGGPSCRYLMERGLDRYPSSPLRQGRGRPPHDHDSPCKAPDHRSREHCRSGVGTRALSSRAGRRVCAKILNSSSSSGEGVTPVSENASERTPPVHPGKGTRKNLARKRFVLSARTSYRYLLSGPARGPATWAPRDRECGRQARRTSRPGTPGRRYRAGVPEVSVTTTRHPTIASGQQRPLRWHSRAGEEPSAAS